MARDLEWSQSGLAGVDLDAAERRASSNKTPPFRPLVVLTFLVVTAPVDLIEPLDFEIVNTSPEQKQQKQYFFGPSDLAVICV